MAKHQPRVKSPAATQPKTQVKSRHRSTTNASNTEPMATQPKLRGKQASILTLLGRAQGATISSLIEATGWQRHTLRAALSGLRKRGHEIERDQTKAGESRYRIGSSAKVTPSPAKA